MFSILKEETEDPNPIVKNTTPTQSIPENKY
jgi:hypothetical protein